MTIQRLGVTSFRNLVPTEAVALPPAGLLVAAAPNAYGKTNFLESLVVLLRGKSWRARLEECVQWGEESFVVWGDVQRGEEDATRLAVRYHQPLRRLRIEEDGEVASLVSFYGRYPLVLFLPEDTLLLARGPVQRRNFLNHILVAHPTYLSSLVQYQRALKQRNYALKRAREFDEVAGWTELLAEHGEVLWRFRQQLSEFIDARLPELYAELSGDTQSLVVQLQRSGEKDDYIVQLERIFDRERRFGHTLLGPHRDDLLIATAGRPAAAVLSQGQVRSLVVALKILGYHYIRQVTKETPLLLLDDVLSELDETRQRALLTHVPTEAQVLLTCTAMPPSLKRQDDVYVLNLGSVVGKPKGAQRGERVPVAADDGKAVEVAEASVDEASVERVAVL